MVLTKGYMNINDIEWSCPSDLKPYEEAFKLNQKLMDNEMWRMGMYIQSAVTTSLDHSFNGKKAKSSYVEEPLLTHEWEYDNMTQEEIDQIEIQKLLSIEKKWQVNDTLRGLPTI